MAGHARFLPQTAFGLQEAMTSGKEKEVEGAEEVQRRPCIQGAGGLCVRQVLQSFVNRCQDMPVRKECPADAVEGFRGYAEGGAQGLDVGKSVGVIRKKERYQETGAEGGIRDDDGWQDGMGVPAGWTADTADAYQGV